MSEKVCRWGILSTAGIAQKNWHSIANSGNGQVVAVASRSIEKAQRFIDECSASVPVPQDVKAYGSYEDLLAALRRGGIDFLIGALRDPAPADDVEQVPLFADRIALVAGLNHPLAHEPAPSLEQLAGYPWLVPRRGAPTRAQFDRLFAPLGAAGPKGIIESGSIMLMRELLGLSDHLGCISRAQAEAELSRGLLIALPFETHLDFRPIGLTLRSGWVPTAAQKELIDLLGEVRP